MKKGILNSMHVVLRYMLCLKKICVRMYGSLNPTRRRTVVLGGLMPNKTQYPLLVRIHQLVIVALNLPSLTK